MKKVLIAACVMIGMFAIVYAGNQYNWGTSNGTSWITPDDTAIHIGDVLVITATSPYAAVGISSTQPLGITPMNIGTINVTTPTRAGLLVYCQDCSTTFLCVSSGSTNPTMWMAVQISTQPTNAKLRCQ